MESHDLNPIILATTLIANLEKLLNKFKSLQPPVLSQDSN
jgi:hypothetical protein